MVAMDTGHTTPISNRQHDSEPILREFDGIMTTSRRVVGANILHPHELTWLSVPNILLEFNDIDLRYPVKHNEASTINRSDSSVLHLTPQNNFAYFCKFMIASHL